MEQWKDIPKTDSYYQISDHGRIRSWKNGKWGRRDNPKLVKIGYCRRGYRRHKLLIDGVLKNFNVHRMVAMLFIPNPDNKPQVNHIDGDKENNHVSNLEWVTNQENMDHARENNLFEYKKGAKNHQSLLGNAADSIRNIYKNSNLTQRQLADAYLVSQRTICSIVNEEYY